MCNITDGSHNAIPMYSPCELIDATGLTEDDLAACADGLYHGIVNAARSAVLPVPRQHRHLASSHRRPAVESRQTNAVRPLARPNVRPAWSGERNRHLVEVTAPARGRRKWSGHR